MIDDNEGDEVINNCEYHFDANEVNNQGTSSTMQDTILNEESSASSSSSSSSSSSREPSTCNIHHNSPDEFVL